ncbi:hypothetical protein FRB94_001373 [Tulasnella sp. JGI-2019a]|nr:hypothetical protein FRB94_001373 [Tulasnella sp. JGI-2019a]
MAYVSAGTKRKRDDDTHELDPERTTIHNQTTLSKLRAAQERLQVLQEEAAALKETEAALSKDIKEINDTLVAGAKAQLRGGPKATRWKWGRLVALTAQWCYGGDGDSIGSCADLKRSLSFAASLRLARNVTWVQWKAIEKDLEHIEAVLRLCSESCQNELDVDWGPYRFCLARQSPELVPVFLLGM